MKFRLVEDIEELNETKAKYNFGSSLKTLLQSFMKDVTYRRGSQTALKYYLCTNRNVPFSEDLDVHHINGKHFDYRDKNIALIKHDEHKKLHQECQNEILSQICNEINDDDIYSPGVIELSDLNSDIENIIRSEYEKLLLAKIRIYRVDK